MGHRFLRHIERNATLLFTIPSNAENIVEQYRVLLRELQAYNAELLDKPRVLAITKCDLIDEEFIELIKEEISSIDIPTVFVSGVSGLGLNALKDILWTYIDRQRSQEAFD